MTKMTEKQSYLRPTFYNILGIIREYFSRAYSVSSTTTVEKFYPNEKKVADEFGQLLEAYNSELGNVFQIKKIEDKQGFVHFEGGKMANLINSFYSSGNLDESIFENVDISKKLAYLKGAYLIDNKNNSNLIALANSPEKTDRVCRLLKELGCSEVCIYKCPDDFVPTVRMVYFTPTENLIKELKIANLIVTESQLLEEYKKLSFHVRY